MWYMASTTNGKTTTLHTTLIIDTATQTVGHMILAAGLTLYIVVAVNLFEEAKLIEEFGESYRKYQRDVPYQFIPLIL
jgi:protein-S-isoprenylcysteine O-methyltransferase Ste14